MRDWHNMYGGREWRVTPAGIETRDGGRVTLHRTPGEPLSVRLYLAFWGGALVHAATVARVPVSLLLMTICTENGAARVDGNKLVYPAIRKEPGYRSDKETPHRISVGPCHVLLSTARAVLGRPKLTREELADPALNILAAAQYIADQSGKTRLDPILVAAAYNAGGLYQTSQNPWRLRSTGNHLDRAAAWYGDACDVLADAGALAELDAEGYGRVAFAAEEVEWSRG